MEKFSVKIGKIADDISSLSGGNMQKLIIAREMYLKPRLLIASQPTRGCLLYTSTDIMDTKLFPSHRACRDAGLTHYEWLVNLTALIGAGEFMFYGVPLLLDQGTGSPVRAFAVLED